VWARIVIAAAATALTAALAGCGSGDSTVAKTPPPRTILATTTAPPPAPPPTSTPPPPPPSPPAAAADPCAVNLAAPEITEAAASLPPDPGSGQGWSPEPLAGDYNECAELSAVIVRANTNAANPNTRAILFHQGKFIPTGAPDTFGFNGVDESVSTGDTVALKYSNGVSGLDSIVKFRWNGDGVELVANTG
jgi:hypothetical protein